MSLEETYGIDNLHQQDAQHDPESEHLENTQYKENEQEAVAQLKQGETYELNEANKDTSGELVQLVNSLSTEQIEHNDTAGAYGFKELPKEIPVTVEA